MLSYPFFILYVSLILFIATLLPIYFKKRKFLALFFLFGFLGIISAFYSYMLTSTERLILVVFSALFWLSPVVSFLGSLVSLNSKVNVNVSEENLGQVIYSFLREKKFNSRCHDRHYKKFLVASSFFNTNIKVNNSSLYLSSRVNSSVLNILRVIFLILVGYSSYAFYIYYFETDIVKLATSLSIISIIVVFFIGFLFNLNGFLENHHSDIKSYILREIKKLTETISMAEAIKIAKKIKEAKTS